MSDPMQAVRGLDRARWMTQFGAAIADRSMSQLCMVGAHDAATHNIDRRAPSEYAADAPEALVHIATPLQPAAHRLAADWARTQEHSMRSMLQLGVRYFDLRVSPRGPTRELWLTHGLYSMPLSVLVEDVASFFGASVSLGPTSPDVGHPAAFPAPALAANRDVIVLDVQRLSGIQAGYGSAKIHQEFFRQLEPLRPLLLKEGQDQTTPLREFWATDTRIIVLYPCVLACAVHLPLVLPRSSHHIRSEWFNRNEARDLLRCLRDELVRRRNSIMTALVMCGGASKSGSLDEALPPPPDAAAAPDSDGAPPPEEGGASNGAALDNDERETSAATVSESPRTPKGFREALSSNDALRQLHILQGVLTPSTADFIRMLMSPMPGTARKLEDFATSVNSRVLTLWGAHAGVSAAEVAVHPKLAHVPLDGRNVLMMDFFTRGRDEATGLDSVQLCHYVNVRRFGPPASTGAIPRPLVDAARIVGSTVVEGDETPVVATISTNVTPRASAAPDGESQEPPSRRRAAM
eukprot:CAMPEP_0174842508 /NCGR_PEP_ID=MMETSP1114-20130205/9958_1 /TAXON_ID=312471 /ORGANISM="Neobodo designis, Strain CCAP 1951/1" /LENGTH=520 /DNA_ID=CAMNT_0016076713 /DNA_START=83 /DNA_END=1642 /DNA_ORIENTATION=+